MAALAAAAAENPAPPHDAAVAAAGFRRTGVQGAKCVHDIVAACLFGFISLRTP